MAAVGSFAVDLDELDRVVAEMARCGDKLEALVEDVSHRVDLLHATWTGAAASAQADAQRAWEHGFRQMHAALATMRAAAGRAHGNYLRAATTNVRMWGQLR